ncbi:MAG: TolC family protein [Candidatus Aminicenantes bacterium]|nr:TolC family protein [Candidatus Aminicenantes bacterium]
MSEENYKLQNTNYKQITNIVSRLRRTLQLLKSDLTKVFAGVQGAVFSKSAPWPPEARLCNAFLRRGFVLFIVLLLVFCGTAAAETLDIDAYLALVKQNSKDLKLAKKELDMARVHKKEAAATALPKLMIEANYRRNLKDIYLFIDFPDFQTGEMTNQSFKINYKNEYGLTAVLNQTLFSFKVGTALRAAKQYGKLTGFAYKAADQAIITAAKKIFYQTLLLEKVWQVTEAAEKNAHENFLNMQKKFDNGQISQFKLLQAEVRRDNLTPETTKARRNYELVLNNLKNLAGIAVEKKIALNGSLENYPPLPAALELAFILDSRPDYNALLWEEKLRRTAVKAESAERYPSLDLNLIYNFSSLSDQFKFERQNKSYIVGLHLSFPVYTGGYRLAQIQKAKIERDKTRIKIEQSKERIYNQAENIRLRLQEAQKRILSGRKSLQTAKKAFEIAQISADNGLATQLELKDVRMLYDQATLNCYASVYDYLDAYFDWQQALGKVENK